MPCDSELSLVSTLPLPNNFSSGLGGRTLRVLVKEWTYYVIVSQANETQITYSGVLIDLLQELATRLNFSYTLTLHPPHLSWGQELDNGSWDGPIGILTRKEADVALGVFTLTAGRSSVVDPTSPLTYENSVIIFKKEPPIEDILSFFLQPFQTPVYVAIGGCFISVLVLLLFLEKCRWWFGGRQRATPFLHALMEDAEALFAGLIQRAVEFEIEFLPGRVLMWAWLMLGVVLASVYSSKLTSSLTVSDQSLPFTSLSQLLNQDTYTWGVVSGVSLESRLKTTRNAEYRKFYEGMLRFVKDDPTVNAPTYDVHKSKVLSGRYAFFTSDGDLFDLWSRESCDLARIPEIYMTNSKVLYLQKYSPYTKMFSKEIERMVEAGLIEYWKRKWRPPSKQCYPDVHQHSRVIGLAETQAAFYLSGVGLGLAALTLGIECLVHKSGGVDVG
ncbi:hypothetical protein BaRGS_00019526 [Batillaria attramentaria]|uniref:Uncharacterized protein n=1 Tax=Batillaria attramentaria TaxID=370345 RepID=A0ABD0KQ67_9CAEN